MILVTGGTGFIGSHTVQALLDADRECVLISRRADPAATAGWFSRPVEVVAADVTDRASLAEVGRAHPIDAIVHLAGSMPWPPSDEPPVAATRRALGGLLNLFELAQEWGVRRVCVASTIGVYDRAGTDGALTEELPVRLTSAHLIPTFKKIGELIADHLDGVSDLEIVNLRISGTWGPRGHADPFFAAPELVHAAADGRAPDLSALRIPAFSDSALDLCYVKDTGRAIAALALAERLEHRTYNVASGHPTTNAQIIESIRRVIPDADIDLPAGDGSPRNWLDVGRLLADTDYTPGYDTDAAAADYLDWLRSGHAA